MEWTISQDAILMSMKAGGEGWTAISRALGCRKHEAHARYKELAKSRGENPSTSAVSKSSVMPTDAVYGGPPTNSNVAQSSSPRTGTNSRATVLSSTQPGVSSADNEWSPESGYAQQRRREEYAVAMLSRLYLVDGNGNGERDIQPDAHFSALDCWLLRLLNAKHQAEQWQELQAEFFNATGRMVDAGVLRQQLDVEELDDDDRVGSDDGFGAEDRRILRFLNDKREDEKWLSVQAGFFNGAGRMVDLHVLKQKLGGNDENLAREE